MCLPTPPSWPEVWSLLSMSQERCGVCQKAREELFMNSEKDRQKSAVEGGIHSTNPHARPVLGCSKKKIKMVPHIKDYGI